VVGQQTLDVDRFPAHQPVDELIDERILGFLGLHGSGPRETAREPCCEV
jgi:hypothetical protein